MKYFACTFFYLFTTFLSAQEWKTEEIPNAIAPVSRPQFIHPDSSDAFQSALDRAGFWQSLGFDNQNVSCFSPIIIDEDDTIFISYYESSGLLNVAKKQHGVWSTLHIDLLENLDLELSKTPNTIAISQLDDRIGIAYSDERMIKFASIINNQVDIEVVVVAGEQIQRQVIALDILPNGMAHIVYNEKNKTDSLSATVFIAKKDIIKYRPKIVVKQLSIFPNPVLAGEVFYFSGQQKMYEYELFNRNGQLAAYQVHSKDAFEVPIGMESGHYVLKLTRNNGKEFSFAKVRINF